MMEEAILVGGMKGKESCIRSSMLINLIHDAVKFELMACGLKKENIYPHFGESKPEIKLAGLLKQKNQDICVLPAGIEKNAGMITWGPMAFQNKTDLFGFEFSTNILTINVRSQMSSLAKNADTLFERTFAEALNLHMRYPQMVLGEVYLIPVYEYDDNLVREKEVGFKMHKTDVEKYISFFSSINNRRDETDEPFKYERCALLIVDFRYQAPVLFRNSTQLKNAGIISKDFAIEYAELSFDTFAEDIIKIYSERYKIENIQESDQMARVKAYGKDLGKIAEK